MAVGVDVEEFPAPASVADLSSSLHPREHDELRALPQSERTPAFTRCWARKEAYLKGTGEGLAAGAERDYLGIEPEPAALPG